MKFGYSRTLAFAVCGATLPLLACAATTMENDSTATTEKDGPSAAAEQTLYANGDRLWTRGQGVHVCWSFDGYDVQKNWIKSAVQTQWFANADVRFTGWERCGRNSDKYISINSIEGNPNSGVGTKAYSDGINLNMSFNNWQNGTGGLKDCRSKPGDDSTYKLCTQSIAVHEFGHALGWSHEQNRSDTPSWCADQNLAQGTDGTIFETVWDQASIMNYCNKNNPTGQFSPIGQWDGGGILSPLDILGTQRIYGRKPGGTLLTYDGRCVDVRYGANADFTAVQAYDCQASDPHGQVIRNGAGDVVATFPSANANQRWGYDPTLSRFTWLGGNAGRVLDVFHGGVANGTPVETYHSTRALAQQWDWVDASLVGVAGKCLDVLGYTRNEGNMIDMWTCNGLGNQKIAIRPTATPTLFNIVFTDPFYSHFPDPNGAMCLDRQGELNGSRVVLATCNPSSLSQSWHLSPEGTIENATFGLCVDVAAPDLGTFNAIDGGMVVQMWQCNGRLNQQFSLRGKLQGLGGKCLDVPFTPDSNYDAGNGKQLQTWDCLANQPNQVFTYTW